MTGVTLTLLVCGVMGLLVFVAWLAELAGPNPLLEEDDRRQARPLEEIRRHERQVAWGAAGVIAVLVVVVATFPQGTP